MFHTAARQELHVLTLARPSQSVSVCAWQGQRSDSHFHCLLAGLGLFSSPNLSTLLQSFVKLKPTHKHPTHLIPYPQVNASGTAFAAALESLPLDELELGSLRGVLVGAVMDVDLAAQTGRLTANLASPRFSGLAGTSLSTTARWAQDRGYVFRVRAVHSIGWITRLLHRCKA